MVAEIDPLGKQISYAYDGKDNLIEKIDRNGRMTTYAYDDLGRVIQEQWVGTTNAITYSYDGIGNLTKISDQTSSLTYTYDLLNRVRTVDNIGTPGAPRSILTYTYDATGNVTAVVDTLDGGPGAATNYSYDAMNRLTRVTQTGQGLSDKRVDLAYNQAGQTTQIQRFSDLAGQNKVIATQFDYDQANRLAKIDHLNSANTAVGFFHYTYDSANRITSIAELDNVTQYTYDQTDQLTAANYSDPSRTDELYRYDANGNRLATHVAPSGYQTGAANRLVSDGVHTYTYDAEGNMITQTMIATGAVRTFVWDHRNRLVSVTDKLSDGTVQMHAGYVYDTLDRRIAKRVTQGSQPTKEMHFIYDREDIIVDSGKAVGASVFEYKRYLHGGGIDEVFAEQAVGSEAHWLLTDQAGSIRMTMHDNVLVELHISSFGELSETNSSTRNFTGREFDHETGLTYVRSRYYDSQTGRFLSDDPLAFGTAEVNLYRYVKNSPTNYVDLDGLDASSLSELSGQTMSCLRQCSGAFQRTEGLPSLEIPIPVVGGRLTEEMAVLAGLGGEYTAYQVARYATQILPNVKNIPSWYYAMEACYARDGMGAATDHSPRNGLAQPNPSPRPYRDSKHNPSVAKPNRDVVLEDISGMGSIEFHPSRR